MATEDNKTWTIVKFVEDDSVALVPTPWIINTEDCLWPPIPTNKISSVVKSYQINTCWPTHKISAFRNATFDNYDTARKKLSKAEDTSDLNSDYDGPRKRKIVARHLSTSSSSSSGEEVFKVIKSPPKLIKNRRIQEISSSKNKEKKAEVTKKLDYGDGAESVAGTSDNFLEYNVANEQDSLHEDMDNSSSAAAWSTPKNTNKTGAIYKGTKKETCSCCPHHVEYLREILRQIGFLKSRVSDLLNKPAGEPKNVRTSVLDSISPCDNEEDIQRVNEILKDKDTFKMVVAELSNLGGRTTYEFVARCLRTVMTDSLASTYSWLGRRQKNKFCDTLFAKLILAAAEDSKIQKNKKESEEAIATWLRRATDRLKVKNK